MPGKVVWEIGWTVSERMPFDPPPEHADTFVVGETDLASWEPVQRGPLDAVTGYEPVTRTIVFDLEAVDGPYELEVEVMSGFSPTPDLDIGVNGRIGRYAMRPEAGAKRRTIRVPVHAGWLRDGRNELTLTTVSAAPDEAERSHAQPRGTIGSAIAYRRVALERAASREAAPAVAVRPLPLYQARDDGIVELVEVTLTAPDGFAGAAGTLVIGELAVPLAFEPEGRCHGSFTATVEVPALDEPVPARVELDVDGSSVAAELVFRPARRFTIHVIPQVHLDIGFTDYQAKTLEVHTRNLDRALALLDEHPDYRFGVDGALVVREYLASHAPEACAKLLDALRHGRIGVQAFSVLFLSGIASLEECFRAAAISAALERDHGVEMRYANLTDVPSYSGAIPSVLAALGVDGFMGMMNHARARTASTDEVHEISPFWWEGPDGARVLTSFVEGYIQLRAVAGNPPNVAGAAEGLARLCERYDRDDYAPADLPVAGSHADNLDIADGAAAFAERWNAAYAWPRVVFATIGSYLDAVRPCGDRLPVLRGDGGSFWEDGVGAAAGPVARYREAQARLPAAEALAALVAAVDPALAPPRAELDRGWDELLYGCEHTWTWAHCLFGTDADQTVDQLAWKVHRIEAAHRIATDELRRGMSRLGELVSTPGPSVLVFNPSSWERDDVAEIELGRSDTIDAELEVVADLGATRRVRFRTGPVPPFGYRVYPLVKGSPGTPAGLDAAGATIETARYVVSLRDGRVTSLVHRASGRELVDATSPYALEVLYVTGAGTGTGRGMGAEQTTLSQSSSDLPLPDLQVTRAAMRAAGVRRTPVGTTIVLQGSAPSLPSVRCELRLRDDDDRVDVVVALEKEAVLAKESVYVAFPFASRHPTVRYDRQVGWVDPATDHLPGACNEWFTTQHGVGLEASDGAIVWTSADAPLFCIGDIVRGRWPDRFEPPPCGTILSWPMNNYWFTNYPASQEGNVTLRYAFRPLDAWDAAAAARFGREVRTPLACSEVSWWEKDDHGPRPLPGATSSLLDVQAPGAVVTVAGSSEPGGWLVRAQDVGGAGSTVRLTHPAGPGGRARACTAAGCPGAEIDVIDGRVVLAVPPNGVTSVLLAR